MISDQELINEKVAGFFLGAMRMGYDYDDAWSLLLSSKQGQGILNNEYAYSVHFQGTDSARKANMELGTNYNTGTGIEPDIRQLELLADLIDIAHNRFGIEYKDIFKKTSLNDFMDTCGYVLGNYDDKLIKGYLI
ncbi:MAG: hypothetical protein J5819_04770 [Eubacterium sp.]|nr:hypothetical protein [Eubacterium sp.]